MTAKKTGLGRGLEALLGPNAARPMLVVGDRPSEPPAEELSHLPLDLLQRGAYQPRIDMRSESLTELAESIKAQGVVQPIIVRPLPRTAGSMRYEIIAGERRWRAAQLAGLSEIPALVRRVDDRTAIALALIENIQRENLNPLEEARALDRLISEFSLTHQEAAAAVGRSRAAVSNLLRLLELSDEVKGLLERRELEMGHARALLPLESRRQQAEVALLVAKKSLSVRETEALVRRLQRPADDGDRAAPSPDADVSRLATELSEKLGAQVVLKHNASGRGQLIVRFTSLDELDGILAHIH
jgi:ParB family chromosome partitioning protein